MAYYHCLLFDVDGTLLDTLPDLTAVTNATLESYGFPLHSQQEILVRRRRRQAPDRACGTRGDGCGHYGCRIRALEAHSCGAGHRLTKEYKGITEALSASCAGCNLLHSRTNSTKASKSSSRAISRVCSKSCMANVKPYRASRIRQASKRRWKSSA